MTSILLTTTLKESDTDPLGRLDPTMLAQQAQMELFAGGLERAFVETLQDDHGAFLNVCDWTPVDCDEDDNVTYFGPWDVFGGVANFDFLPSTLLFLKFQRRPMEGGK